MLQRALDRRHRSAVAEFGRARTTEDLKALWAAAVQRAEIPGAYWAVLTHPRATEKLVQDVFAEVHILSHLVGAANRADIRRSSRSNPRKVRCAVVAPPLAISFIGAFRTPAVGAYAGVRKACRVGSGREPGFE